MRTTAFARAFLRPFAEAVDTNRPDLAEAALDKATPHLKIESGLYIQVHQIIDDAKSAPDIYRREQLQRAFDLLLLHVTGSARSCSRIPPLSLVWVRPHSDQ
jgi:hypothetical protein